MLRYHKSVYSNSEVRFYSKHISLIPEDMPTCLCQNDKTAFRTYLEDHEECRQLDVETFEALTTLTHAEELKHYRLQEEEETTDMCKAITELIADGKEEGLKQGETKGRLEILFELVRDNLLSIKDAAIKASLTETAFSDAMKRAGY